MTDDELQTEHLQQYVTAALCRVANATCFSRKDWGKLQETTKQGFLFCMGAGWINYQFAGFFGLTSEGVDELVRRGWSKGVSHG